MAAYLEAVEAHNEAADPNSSKLPVQVSDWMRNRMRGVSDAGD